MSEPDPHPADARRRRPHAAHPGPPPTAPHARPAGEPSLHGPLFPGRHGSRPPGAGRRGGRRAGQPSGQTREAILQAARHEFAARGYDAAGVDLIARTARVNKAMSYYHFGSKAGLYHGVLREMFDRAGEQVRAIVRSANPPEVKLDAIVQAIVARVTARPELPPIMMREVAEGARHLDTELLRAMSGLYRSVAAVVAEGQRHGRFGPVRPLLAYFTLVGPLILFLGGAPVRRAMARLKGTGDWDCGVEEMAAHLQHVMRGLLLTTGSGLATRRLRPAGAEAVEKRT